MKKLEISKITRKEFDKRLKLRSLENLTVVHLIESFFLKKRGYIFKMPKPGTPVILLVSGGLDSIITWALLMHKYKLLVYPLFLHRGAKRYLREKKSVTFFSKSFQKRYPANFIEPFEFTNNIVIPELEKLSHDFHRYYHPARILENIDFKTGAAKIVSQSGMPIVYPFYGVSYASYLWDHKNIKIRTIFNAVATEDGSLVTSQTFTALRTTLLAICVSRNEYDWQFASFLFEKELGQWIDKADLIRLGSTLRLPLEKTWSCYFSHKYQCGNNCAACTYRRSEFQKSGVVDKTIYESDISNLKNKVCLVFSHLKNKLIGLF